MDSYITLIVASVLTTLALLLPRALRRFKDDGTTTLEDLYYKKFQQAVNDGEQVEATIYEDGITMVLRGDELLYVTPDNLIGFRTIKYKFDLHDR